MLIETIHHPALHPLKTLRRSILNMPKVLPSFEIIYRHECVDKVVVLSEGKSIKERITTDSNDPPSILKVSRNGRYAGDDLS